MPTIERRDVNALELQISIELTQADYLPKLESELKKFKNRAAMKGFRPGHTPMAVVKKMYGQSIMVEAINDLTVKSLYGYLQEHNLPVIFQPIPTADQEHFAFNVNEPRDFTFKFDVGLEPQFEIAGLSKDQKFEKLTIADLGKLAEEDLEYARKRMGERVNPTDDVQLEDIIKIDAREANKPNGHATEITFLVKSIPNEDLRAYFLTKKAGDSVRFHPREGDSFADEKKYRRFVLGLEDKDDREIAELFEGKIIEVSRVALPEVDQAFFDKYFGEGQVTSREEALEKIGENVARHYSGQAEGLLMRDFQQRLLELNTFGLPEAFLRRWLLQADAKNTPEMVEAGYAPFAENLRWTFLREKLKAEFAIEITPEAVQNAFEERVRGYFGGQMGDNPGFEGIVKSTAQKLMADEKQVREIEDTLLYDGLFKGIADRVTIVEKPIPSAELQAMIASAQRSNEARDEAELAA